MIGSLRLTRILSRQNPSPAPRTPPLLTSLQCGSLLQALTCSKSIEDGKKVHAHAVSSGLLINNTYLSTKLAAFYAICGRMDEARTIFDNVVLKNSFLWNSMIRGYAVVGSSEKSLLLYREMSFYGRAADNFTYPFVLMACGDLGVENLGRCVHCKVLIMGFESDIYVGNSLLMMYLKFGDMGTAQKLFDAMPKRDLTSWNTMISGMSNNGDPLSSLVFLNQMVGFGVRSDRATILSVLPACADLASLKHGKEIHGYVIRCGLEFDGFVRNSLIEMYSRCRFMTGARHLFEKMVVRDLVSWNSMISGYSWNEDSIRSINIFRRMISEGVLPDETTIVVVLGACEKIAALQLGRLIHARVVQKGFYQNIVVGTALVDVYAKCGSFVSSRRVFDEMPARNVVSWSAMIDGYGLHGRGREAIAIFLQMEAHNVRPDKVTFTSLLSACSHSGLVHQGREIFRKMLNEYSIEPTLDHYSCMVDLLGRAGLLEEAHTVIKNMLIKPNADVWVALLSACRVHRNIGLAELSAQRLLDLDPKSIGPYVSLSNIFAVEKRWNDVERVRSMARSKGLKKLPGCSFVDLDNEIHCFIVGDKSHPQSESICVKLNELRWQLKEIGYMPDTSSVLYDVEEDVKEKLLWDHSERLAIAFALLNTRFPRSIRITKNLRICSDCHTVTKLISKISCREIIVRDARRFHHFKGGSCSCGDYW